MKYLIHVGIDWNEFGDFGGEEVLLLGVPSGFTFNRDIVLEYYKSLGFTQASPHPTLEDYISYQGEWSSPFANILSPGWSISGCPNATRKHFLGWLYKQYGVELLHFEQV